MGTNMGMGDTDVELRDTGWGQRDMGTGMG